MLFVPLIPNKNPITLMSHHSTPSGYWRILKIIDSTPYSFSKISKTAKLVSKYVCNLVIF